SDDNGRANADQKEDQNDQDQHHAAEQVGFYRISGQRYQFAAVIVRTDFDVRREYRPIQFIRLFLNGFEDVLRLLPAKHQYDALNGVVVLLKAKLAEPRSMADPNIANVFYANGNAIITADHNVSNIAGVSYQSDAAHIVKLPTLGIESAARI